MNSNTGNQSSRHAHKPRIVRVPMTKPRKKKNATRRQYTPELITRLIKALDAWQPDPAKKTLCLRDIVGKALPHVQAMLARGARLADVIDVFTSAGAPMARGTLSRYLSLCRRQAAEHPSCPGETKTAYAASTETPPGSNCVTNAASTLPDTHFSELEASCPASSSPVTQTPSAPNKSLVHPADNRQPLATNEAPDDSTREDTLSASLVISEPAASSSVQMSAATPSSSCTSPGNTGLNADCQTQNPVREEAQDSAGPVTLAASYDAGAVLPMESPPAPAQAKPGTAPGGQRQPAWYRFMAWLEHNTLSGADA